MINLIHKLHRTLSWAAVIFCLHLSSAKVAAQAGLSFADLDPQQMRQQIQQRMITFFKAQLVVTNDEEWSVIEKRLTKVVQMKAQALIGGQLQGGAGLFGRRQGGDNPMARVIMSMLGLDEPMPEMQALQKAMEYRATTSELKAAISKVTEARKRKQAELAKAQSELCEVLSLRQEATLAVLGVID